MCYFVLVYLYFFSSPFSIAITSLVEEIANLSVFRTFVRFVLVWVCLFTLPLGVWEGLRLVIVNCATPWTFLLPFSWKHARHEQPQGHTSKRWVKTTGSRAWGLIRFYWNQNIFILGSNVVKMVRLALSQNKNPETRVKQINLLWWNMDET